MNYCIVHQMKFFTLLFISMLALSSCEKDDSAEDNKNNNNNNNNQQSNACGTTTTVTDIDGNTYKVISTGNFCWMAENLRVTKFNNGTPIPHKPTSQDWYDADGAAWCYLNNDPNTEEKYGKMYKGHTIQLANDNSLNICPEGWRLPTWTELQSFVKNDLEGPSKEEKANEVKSTSDWDGTQGNNSTGFNAYPGGYRDGGSISKFVYVGELVQFMTSYISGSASTQITTLRLTDDDVTLGDVSVFDGAYCRCIKDK
ncbi:MAG: fibrobacter succinogenes major paralogous domain-containing protein [Chitinophagales bacterium]